MTQARRKAATLGEAGYARRTGDSYFTEPWVTRALIAAVNFSPPGKARSETLIWEPACGDGRMAQPLKAAGYTVVASDIADHGYGETGVDFLSDFMSVNEISPHLVAAIVTNPPFDTVDLFIERALELTRPTKGRVAMLQRHEFDAPRKNHRFFRAPFAAKLVLHKRPRWVDGEEKASPRFPYAWFLWDWRWRAEPVIRYLPDPDVAGGAAPLIARAVA